MMNYENDEMENHKNTVWHFSIRQQSVQRNTKVEIQLYVTLFLKEGSWFNQM